MNEPSTLKIESYCFQIGSKIAALFFSPIRLECLCRGVKTYPVSFIIGNAISLGSYEEELQGC
jgi:hypothetical protein